MNRDSRTPVEGDDRGAREPGRLGESRGIAEQVVDALEDAVFVVDETGALVWWNPRLPERLGYDDEELVGLRLRDVVDASGDEDDGDGDESDAGSTAIHVDHPDRTREVALVASDGEAVPHELRETTVTDEETGARYRVVVARDVSARLTRERELERYETIVETASDGIYALDEELRYTLVNDALCEFYDRPREELLDSRVTDLFLFEDDLRLAESMRERVVSGDVSTGSVQASGETPDGETIHAEARYRLHPEPDGEYRGSVGVIRDVTDRVERERRLEHQRDELETLDRINRLLLRITRDLVETRSRGAVERTICAALTASDRYAFAWIAGPDAAGETVRVRMSAGFEDSDGDVGEESEGRTIGDSEGGMDAASASAPASSLVGRDLARRAIRTGDLQVEPVDALVTATDVDGGFEAHSDDADDGVTHTVAAIPVRHEETVYGALVVGATHPDAFIEHERTGFDILGETVGFVVDAIKHRALLFADRVVELSFHLRERDSLLQSLSRGLGCSVSLDGSVATDEGWILFLSAADADPTDVVAVATDRPEVERARIVGEGADRRIELVVTRASTLETLSRMGATVRSAEAAGGTTRFVLEAPAGADVRELVELLRSTYPSTELRALQERNRPPEEVRIPEGILDELTERQREALEAAYHAGYFSWPRDSTAQEVAAALDVAPPTLHAHLRKAERTLLSALFDAHEE